MLFHVYKADVPAGHYLNEPTGIYRTLLDADWLLWILLPLLLVIVVIVLMVAWRLHEIPKHKAEHKKMRQAELVSTLTLIGMFEHWVWVVALFIAFTDWEAIEDACVRILRRAHTPPAAEAQLGESAAQPIIGAEAVEPFRPAAETAVEHVIDIDVIGPAERTSA